MTPGRSFLLLGSPGSGKSTLAQQAARAEGGAMLALAPGLDEATSYRHCRGERFLLEGFDDPDFFPAAGSLKATGYDALIRWLRERYVEAKADVISGKPPRYPVLVTDTFNGMASLAMNKTLAHLGVEMPPPAMSPTGAAFWGYQRNLCEALMRACRTIRGLGVHWIATCHVADKEVKDTAMANPDMIAAKGNAIVPAIQGGFRDVLPAAFDLVLHMGVTRGADKKPLYYIQWQSDSRKPTRSRYGALAEQGKIAADWTKLTEKLAALDAAGV